MPHPDRNHLIDLARVASVAVVVVFHCLLYRIVPAGDWVEVRPWAPDHIWWILSWPLMIMPLFFVAGGFAHAVITDRLDARGTSFAGYLSTRAGRLAAPMLTFLLLTTPAWTVAAWFDQGRAVVDLSRQFAQLLWFIATYLVIVALAPALVRLHDRAGGWAMLPMLAAAIAVDAWSFRVGAPQLRYLNLLTVWPLCHQLGIAYQRGWFRRGSMGFPLAALAVTLAVIPTLIFGFGYPGSSVGLADLPIANVQPPTVAMAVLALGQAAVLGLIERAGWLATLPTRMERTVAIAGALLMTVYLWHIPCILLAGLMLFGVSRLVPAATEALLSQPSVALLTLVLVVLLIPLIGRLDARLAPRTEQTRLAPSLIGYLLLTAGVCLVWLNGTLLSPLAPWSAVGLLAVAVGALTMRRRSSPTRVA